MNWNETTLGEVAILNYGKGLPAKQRKMGSIPVYGSNGIVGTHDKAHVSCPGIIVGRKGSVGAVHISHKEFCAIDTTYYITPKDTKCDLHFLYYLLIHTNLFRLVSDLVPGLNRDLAYSQSIIIPSTLEQQKIAALLSAVQRVTEQQERLITLSTELKKALMHKLFTEGTRGEKQKQTEIGLVPESWKVVSIGDTCDIITSSMTYKQLEQAENLFDGAEVMGVKVSDMNIGGNEIEFRTANLKRNIKNNEAQKRTVPADVIIFPKRGAAIATNKKRLTTTWTVLDPNLIAVRPHKGTYYRYLYHWFNTFDLARITDPGPTPQLNKKDVSPLKYPKPDETTQKEISDIIDTVDQKTGNQVELKLLLNELFFTLLHQLMTAQIRVNDLDLTELDYEPIATGEEEVS